MIADDERDRILEATVEQFPWSRVLAAARQCLAALAAIPVESIDAALDGRGDRHVVRKPSSTLQLVLMFDEADLYLPAGMANPPSKKPLQELLRRSRTSGLGVMLASQSPADFDFQSRDLLNTWLVGKIGQATALSKIESLFEQRRTSMSKLGTLAAGRFMLLQDGGVTELLRAPSMLRTDQLPEDELLALACAQVRR